MGGGPGRALGGVLRPQRYRALRLVYEDVMADMQGAVDGVSTLMGLDHRPRADSSRIGLEIQRDDETEAWRARFIGEPGNPDAMDEL